MVQFLAHLVAVVEFSESDTVVFFLHIAVIFRFQISSLWCFHAVGAAFWSFAKFAVCIADACPLTKSKSKGSLQSLHDAEDDADNWFQSKSAQNRELLSLLMLQLFPLFPLCGSGVCVVSQNRPTPFPGWMS